MNFISDYFEVTRSVICDYYERLFAWNWWHWSHICGIKLLPKTV